MDIRNALLKLHRYLESRTTMNGTGTCQFAWKFNSTPCWIFANKNPWIVKWRREFKRQRKHYQTKQAPHFRSTGNKYISILNHDYNRRQNELRHFAQDWGFYVLLTSKGGNIAFPPPSSPCNVVPMFKLPIENNKHPNFEWRGQKRGADSFVLQSYPICVLNNFVADCLNRKSGTCP